VGWHLWCGTLVGAAGMPHLGAACVTVVAVVTPAAGYEQPHLIRCRSMATQTCLAATQHTPGHQITAPISADSCGVSAATCLRWYRLALLAAAFVVLCCWLLLAAAYVVLNVARVAQPKHGVGQPRQAGGRQGAAQQEGPGAAHVAGGLALYRRVCVGGGGEGGGGAPGRRDE
jgi:hypothetical protein